MPPPNHAVADRQRQQATDPSPSPRTSPPPRAPQDFEKLEGQRIDSFKMALKKLLSAQEAAVVAQRPLLFAATDMVDAIAREEDVGDFMQAHSKHPPSGQGPYDVHPLQATTTQYVQH